MKAKYHTDEKVLKMVNDKKNDKTNDEINDDSDRDVSKTETYFI